MGRKTIDNTPPPRNFDAIVIGGSAGGVEALGRLLESLPAGLSASVFAVLHLPPDRVSLLPGLYARRCPLPVKEAEDKEPAAPGMVYMAPPDYHLLVEPGRTLALSRDEAVNFSRPSIDLLFESAALVYRERLLGIILTGASSDGAAGLAEVRACGGSAWIQEPQEATASAMPAAALALGGADAVLTINDIAGRLSRLS